MSAFALDSVSLAAVVALDDAVTWGAPADADLGPLAWVLGEIQKTLDGAIKTLRRQALEGAGSTDPIELGPVRMARQQLHQAVGALRMVGHPAPALVLGAMEFAVQGFVDALLRCDEAAVDKLERAGFATVEYLQALLAGKTEHAGANSVALFPQYRDVLELSAANHAGRIHPADLWRQPWRWVDVRVSLRDVAEVPALAYAPAVRSRLDRDVLKLLVSGDQAAARRLHALCLGLAYGAGERNEGILWALSAAFFEALALALIPHDVYVKRAASRVLLQYATLARGDAAVSDALGHDLLFFCSQALLAAGDSAATLRCVRAAWGLANDPPVDYSKPQFGRIAPLALAQARQRIEAAKALWSTLASGDVSRLRQTVDACALLSESLHQLHPASLPMAQALTQAVDASLRSGQAPGTELAMEVATSVLYLEAVFEDLDPNDARLAARTVQLAVRIERACHGGHSEPLEAWMEDLYRRVSDRRTMGTVVDELRSHLGDLEKALDQYFRRPNEKGLLGTVPTQLLQMRGVFSVLGLDQAAQAVLRMRTDVDQLIAGSAVGNGVDVADTVEVPDQMTRQVDSLGNNLGALGFLVDMLAYQPALAKRLFVFDAEAGELKPVMGRHSTEVVTEDILGLSGAAALEADPRPGFGSLTTPAPLMEESVALTGDAADADLTARLAALAEQELPRSLIEEFSRATASWSSRVAGPASPEVSLGTEVTELGEDDLNDIFLGEAREVLLSAMTALAALSDNAGEDAQQTVLRRAFHTLKGSSRMIGLNDFGNAAWSLEQLLNIWLADQRPVTPELLSVVSQGVQDLGQWVQAIASGVPHAWRAQPIQQAADALRLGDLLPTVARWSDPQALVVMARQIADVSDGSDESDDPQAVIVRLEPAVSFQRTAPKPSTTLPEPFVDAPLLPVSTVPPVDGAGAPPHEFDVSKFSEFDAPFEWDVPASVELVVPWAEPVDFLPPPDALALPDVVGVDGADGTHTSAVPAAAPAFASAFTRAQPPENFSLAAQLRFASDDSAAPAAALLTPAPDDAVKVVGALRIGTALYNVYLNEADEWSRRLVSDLDGWAMAPASTRVPESSIALAHSLAGSSATVGFHGLSGMARLLEAALQQLRRQRRATADDASVLIAAAAELRGLLHQFAAGFLLEPNPETLALLSQLGASLMPPVALAPDDATIARPLQVAPLEDESNSQSFFADTPLVDALFADAPFADAPFADAPFARSSFTDARSLLPAPGHTLAALPSAPHVLLDDDADAIDVFDAVDAVLFPIFEEEAVELLPQLGAALRAWAQRPEDDAPRAATLRALHTLKGSARLAGAMRLGERAHSMESEIDTIGVRAITHASVDGLLARFDVLQATFDRLRSDDAAQQEALAQQVNDAALPGGLEALGAVAALDTVDAPASAPALTDDGGVDAFFHSTQDAQGEPPAAGAAGNVAIPASSVLVPLRTASNQTVRIRTKLLDRLVTQAGEVIITRSRIEASLGLLRSSLHDLTGNLERLRQQLRDVELQAETQMQSRLAQAKDAQQGFDPLEFDRFTRVQELTRMMAESVDDVSTVQRTLQRTVQATEDDLTAQARQTRELQRELLRTRMVEFEGLSERLYRVVRQAAKDTGKPVRLDITGGSIEIDRGVLDRMAPAFEHLLRNSVAHGIEDAGLRAQAGKDASGLIVIALDHEGNDVSVSFQDDGAGLDYQRIAERARALGLLAPGQSLTSDEAAEMIFRPGFSTIDQVSELAGRGIGMDVVRTQVAALGGRIETRSTPGQGTTFKLVLPLTTAVTHVVMLRAGEVSIGVPSTLVELVQRVSGADLATAYASQRYNFAGAELPFFWAGALLQGSPGSDRPASVRANTVVVVRSAAQRIAMHVDDVLGNQEVVVKNLGPQLSRLAGMAGITVLASGAVAMIYNPVALAAVHGEQARRWQGLGQGATASSMPQAVVGADGVSDAGVPAWRQAAPQTPLILVVDDSITVRRVTQRLLLREGYRVVLAADGLQALERLQQERPAVVLSDIEMPRMDGFDLARNIRADAAMTSLPIIMITSRIAEKHREHARKLGVDHYLGKPYSEEELLGLVRSYTSANADVATG